MAALAESRAYLVALGDLGPRMLEPALSEACEAWQRRLHWDYGDTAELIRDYAAMRALDGLALVAGGEVAGYCYWVHEGAKSLIGDLFVRAAWRTAAHENFLLDGALRAMRGGATLPGGARRVEAQLMQIATRSSALLPGGPRPRVYPRLFMLRPALAVQPAARGRLAGVAFECWGMQWKDPAAALIAEAYQGHADSEINDQYRSCEGAARFLRNIVQHPGCGVFLPGASFAAVAGDGSLAGLTLATRVARGTGHIAQLCVREDWRGTGLAIELLRLSLAGLRDAGTSEVSLTVTEQNTRAVALYERTGFHSVHRFDALVWE